MKQKFLSLLIFLSASLSMQAGDDGTLVDYYLPLTAVRMSVLVEHSTFTPGELAAYSELYLKEDVRSEAEESYKIVGVSFTTTALPDTARHYTVVIDKKHSLFSLSRDASGVLRAINTQGKAIEKPQRFQPAKTAKPLNPHDYMSQDILNSGNPNTMARMVAQEIYDIRESRTSISRGEADYMPKDGDQLRMMMQQMDLQEQALRQAFVGNTVVDTAEYVVTFVPMPSKEKQMVCRFSRHFGLTDISDLSGEPVYAVTENLDYRPSLPDIPAEAKKQKDDFQLYVCLPGKVSIAITSDDETFGRAEVYAAQYGEVESLPGSLWGKKFTSRIVLNPVTGSIETLETEPLE